MLQSTAETFGSDLDAARVPHAGAFKKSFSDAVVRFEAARIAGDKRGAIARHLVSSTLGSLELVENGRATPLVEALRERREAPATATRALGGRPGWVAELPLDGRTYREDRKSVV